MMHALACSILRPEIEGVMAELRQEGYDVEVTYLDSALHMRPRKLEEVLSEQLAPGDMILFGDCSAGMTEFERAGHVRVAVPNCMEWLLGRERYRCLMEEGAFFVQREWAERWQAIFQEELGLKDGELAREFFTGMHKMLVYLDTGMAPVPEEALAGMSAFTGLPVRKEIVSMDPLRETLRKALRKAFAKENAVSDTLESS